MNKALLVLPAFMIMAGCSYIAPASNHPPEAFINSITPAEAAVGETVAFDGEGNDPDGDVVGYRWRSDLDGELSQRPSFETNALSMGMHSITFMVQDNNGAWSDEVTGSVRVVASPVKVQHFTATPSTVEAGDSVTLSWTVTDATSVSINQGIGTVATAGSVVVTPNTTTTYTLEAAGASSTATAIVTVTVGHGPESITLTATEESGYIRRSGDYRTIGIYVGDDDANRGIQGFLTFDISDIPDDAVIEQVILDLSMYDIPYHDPFPGLGCLRAFIHEYDSLYGQYQEGGTLPDPVEEWCAFEDLDIPAPSIGLAEELQERIDESRFQLRLQFPGLATDGDETRDMLHWSRDQLPQMTVEYRSDAG